MFQLNVIFDVIHVLSGLAVAGESDTLKHLDCPFNSNLCFWTLKSGEAQFVSSSILPEGSISQSG